VVQAALDSFCDELARRVPGSLETILTGHRRGVGRSNLKQDPEQFVSQYFIWPVCNAVGYEYITEWYHEGHGGSVDLLIRNTTEPVLCEVKRLNDYRQAIDELRDYLSHRTTQTEFGIVTDGITWMLMREPGDSRKNPEIIEFHSFRGAIFERLVTTGDVQPQLEGEPVRWRSSVGKEAKAPYEKYGQLRRVPVTESAEEFRRKFATENVSAALDAGFFDKTLTEYGNRSSDNHPNTTLDGFD